jgi:hypothetical protein
MSKNRMFNTKFWSDSFIVDELNPHDRYLFLYLMLNERTNLCGIYELSIRTISNETGIEKEEVSRMLKRLEPKIYYKHGFVILTNALKHQNYKNKYIASGLQKELCKVPADLIELITIPSDFDMEFSCAIEPKKTKAEDSSGDMHESRVIQYNSIKPNLIKSNSNPIETNADEKAVDKTGTTGNNNLEGRTYGDVSMLFEDLQKQGLVNDQYKGWYCSAFFKLGRDRVQILASQARADGKDPAKLFSHLIQKEVGEKPSQSKISQSSVKN